jgi:isochorismate synthase
MPIEQPYHPEEVSEHLTLLNQATACLAGEKTFILFREPGDSPELWLQNRSDLMKSPDSVSGGSYLTVRPFDGPELYLTADQLIRPGERPVLDNCESSALSATPQSEISDSGYIKLVDTAISTINCSELQKVALSKLLTVETKDLDIVKAFQSACARLPNAFVYLLRSPDTGLWLGATPEKLISFRGTELQIDSIAATRRTDIAPLNMSGWNAKERQEQQIVTTGISEVLGKSGCQNITVTSPQVLQAGPVSHLFSKILASCEGIDKIRLIEQLHPTAAVGGAPKETALRFIRAHEGYERGLYSGFLGVSKTSSTQENYYVNIRCMQVFDEQVQLYLGCGITGSSVPQNELDETRSKARTWLDILAPTTENGDLGSL